MELSRYYLNHTDIDSCIIIAEKGIALSKQMGITPAIEFYYL